MAVGAVTSPLSEWLLVALIIFSLLFELILHRIEHWVHHHHHHLFAVLRVLYRELMILGIISFCFIVFELTSKPSGNTILSFEFAHLFIFLLAIFYTGIILSAMFLSLRLSARWKQMERMDLVQYLNLRDKYTQVSAIVERRSDFIWRTLWWFPNLFKLYNYIRLHEVMTFHDIRFQFIYYRNLPDNFRFSSFLRKIKATTFIDLVESHWSLWVIFLAIVLADIGRREITDTDPEKPSDRAVQFLNNIASTTVRAGEEYGYKATTNAAPTLFDNIVIICAAVLLGAFAQILAWKSRQVYWKLTSHPRMYYEGVEAETVMQELQKLADDREDAKRRRELSRSVASGEDVSDAGNDADEDDEELMMRGRISEAFAENEMLDPMRPQPLRSPLHPATPATGVAAAAAAAAAAAHQTDDLSDGASRPVSVDLSERSVPNLNGMTDSKPSPHATADDSTLIEMGMRHSLQNRSSTDLSALSSQYAQKEHLENASDVGETVRHSMDVPHSGNDHLMPTASTSKSAYIARAAVELARKKSNLDGESSDLMFNEDQLTASVPGLGSPRLMSRSSSSNLLAATEEAKRISVDSRGSRRVGRMSIELAAVMDRDELASQLEDNDELDDPGREQFKAAPGMDDADTDGLSSSRVSLSPDDHRMSRDSRSSGLKGGDVHISMDKDGAGKGVVDVKGKAKKSRRRNTVINATILKNYEAQQIAQQRTPNKYPKFVTKLIPRLGRVASPVEKLFWFGSHKFFLWCVEFVLFFSTVLLSAATAGIALTGTTDSKIPPIEIVGVVLAGVNLLFVLWRIAVILRRYIFILHNASLIPEVVALEAIHTVRSKRVAISDDVDDVSSVSESESEFGESSHERRKRLGRFLRSQAESGKMPGIQAKGEGSETAEDVTTQQRRRFFRSKKRAEAESRREKRINAPFGENPGSDGVSSANQGSNDVVLNVGNANAPGVEGDEIEKVTPAGQI